jgi:phytoene desaturase
MRFHPESMHEAYDAIVIGSGVGGLTAAGLLAREGRRVLVVERHDRVGGYAHAFRRGQRVFDSAVHQVGGQVLPRVLQALGVADQCSWLPIDPVYEAHFPGLSFAAPVGLVPFQEAFADRFPGQGKGVRSLMQDACDIRDEARRAEQLGTLLDVNRAPGRYPTLLRYRRASLARVLDAHIDDPAARSALSALWPYLGLPPSRLSFLYWATMMLSYVEEGTFYCEGSFQRLAKALAAGVQAHGGECLLRSSVRRILVKDGAADGVVLENGQVIRAPIVVSNADLRQTVFELAGAENFPPRYTQAVRKLRASISAFVVYASTRLDLRSRGLAHETFCYPDGDFDAAYASALRGEPSWLSATIPTLVDSTLAPPGEHLVTLTTLVGADSVARWADAKPRLTERLLAMAEAHVPGLAGSLTLAEGATPRTMERYTRNEAGALYGFELSPAQVGPARPDHVTPLPGLFLAGHWSRPGGGVTGAMTSGIQAARKILGALSDDALLG